ncbi:glutamate--cysteine ligase [Halieaceae bacterium IMCC14734]|uniref:Glutamate--cysteine ligase n=1 Tax=Candidatus Litorirhabdus singularis TaxID=2518993 RepID=A0ABT3TB32_9GAMM|nr:glutamate--cysteine ligase [Candidatus Litorirhabdus singularis]MCX2979506.1 glutamate--cysteine ligase [Candidatus Litorirhabdus singularis]
MTATLERRLAELTDGAQVSSLTGIQRGLEKESLRINSAGKLAQTPHPVELGAALTHPYITTDYSEALLEFITPVSTSISATLETLETIHRYTYAHIDDELLWGASMPCILEGDASIPVADYGTSNVGTMKTVYRLGLGHRYGRLMQTIAGIHYNFSMPDAYWADAQRADDNSEPLQDYISNRYLGLIRNFQRHSWLLIYLFGASPAVCKSFLRGNAEHNLEAFDEQGKSMHLPWATSLRMGDLGYQSNAQRDLEVCYNNLHKYIDDLCNAITRNHPAYETIGVGTPEARKQLNTGLLQIENEFYSSIRPKRVAASGETSLGALRRGGIEYIEVRCIDVNPYCSVGIDAAQIRFLDIFLLYCLLEDSPACEAPERQLQAENIRRVVNRGREPGLLLQTNAGDTSLQDLAKQLLTDMQSIATSLDQAHQSSDYSATLTDQRGKVVDSTKTPSAMLLEEMKERELPFFRLAMSYSENWAKAFRSNPLEAEAAEVFAKAARDSLARQTEIEATDSVDFNTYVQNYYEQYKTLAKS